MRPSRALRSGISLPGENGAVCDLGNPQGQWLGNCLLTVKAGYRWFGSLQERSVGKVSLALGNSLYDLMPLGSLENGLVFKNTWA